MKSRKKLILTLLTMLASLSLSRDGYAQEVGVPDLKDRLFREGPAAWAKYSATAIRLQGDVAEKRFAEPTKKLHSEVHFKLKQTAGCASMATYGSSNAESLAHVSVANTKYRFKMGREDKSKSLAVVEVSTDLIDKPPPDRPGLDVVGTVKGVALLPIAIRFNLADDWPSIIASPEFSVTQVVLSVEDGKELVKVDFDLNRGATKENPIRMVEHGTVWFDPSSFWVMRKCIYRMQWGPDGPVKDEQSHYQYRYDKDGFPILKEVTVMYFDRSATLEARKELSFNLSLADIPEREFTLSAYGFPEPDGVVWQTTTRWWLWIGSAAIASVCCGLILARKRREEGPKGSSPISASIEPRNERKP
ncbi:MAG TPA: hypothetical protein VFE62_25420 [Gemmataceae bacterium]|nr:hypothetical protein [Gemmataceae bacterium]